MSQLTFFIDNLCIFAIRKFNCMQLYDEKTSSCQNDEFQDSFVASIVHDLKNLMVPIMSRSELLLMPNISEEKKQNMVKQLNASCYILMDALNKMVRICKERANTGTYHFESFKLLPLVCEVLDVLDESVETKQLSVKVDIPANLSVFADRASILSVSNNLLGNAVKFTPKEGVINVSASRVGEKVKIVVSDNGVGIDEGRIADLLQNNHYYTTPGTNGESGTGLGLLLCQAQLRRNHSSLGFSKLAAGGSEFFFELPSSE